MNKKEMDKLIKVLTEKMPKGCRFALLATELHEGPCEYFIFSNVGGQKESLELIQQIMESYGKKFAN